MATFQSDLATGQFAKGDNRIDGRLLAGKVRQCNAEVTLTGTEAASDEVQLVVLPKGAIIDLENSFVSPASSVGTALKVRIVSPLQNLSPELTLTGATSAVKAGNGLVELAEGDEAITLEITAATATTADVKVRVCLQYINRN